MIWFKEIENRLYVKAAGHITAQHCTQLKKRVFERLEADCPPTHIYVDLAECAYMDSTFLGILAGCNKKFKAATGKSLVVQNVQKTCMDLLISMGLSQLLTIADTPVPFPHTMDDITTGKSLQSSELLEAHENLMELSDENRKKFSALHQILSDKIKKNH